MAEKKKSTNTTAAKKPSARSLKLAEKAAERQREEAIRRSARRHHIASVIMFAVGLFVTLIAFIPGGEGEGWRALFDVMHGLFGYGAYLVGPAVIYSAVLVSQNCANKKLVLTAVPLVLSILMVCAAVQIFAQGEVRGDTFAESIASLYEEGVQFRGGGVFSFILGAPLLLLGQFGAAVLIIIIAIVCVLLVFNISVADMIKAFSKPVKKVQQSAKERVTRYREEEAIADEVNARRDAERAEKKKAARDLKKLAAEEERRSEMSRMMKMADTFDEENKAEQPIAIPEKSAARQEPVAPPPAESEPAPAPKADDAEAEDYMRRISDYIMEKNKDIIEADEEREKQETLEDKDAELIPILDAIARFDKDNAVRPVTKIEDAPASGVTDSDRIAAESAKEAPAAAAAPAPAAKEPAPAPAPAPKAEKPAATSAFSAAEDRYHQQTIAETYVLPPVTLLNPIEKKLTQADIDSEIKHNATVLVDTLKSFGVQTKYVGASRGPSVTRYELQPAPGVKISKITNLADDIALNLAASGVRIAPIPNKTAVGIEVPNQQKDTVYFRELVDTEDFRSDFNKKLITVLGKDIGGNTITCNISKMPHLLIAGTTGSGKSVCVNSIIMSILMKSTPDEVRLIMVDPKKVEFMMYNGIPHLLIPVVTSPKKAAGALAWAVKEMLNRYEMFSQSNVRDFSAYNEMAAKPDSGMSKMPHIVIFIDELADLMLASPKEVEDSIVRLAQMARAAGMHLVIATQRPTVNVVTGLIKANIPSRIALLVASQMDSRVILDAGGAEKLLGNGDMLYMPVGSPKPVRVQGCFVSDKEVERIVEFIKDSFSAEYDESVMEEIERESEMVSSGGAAADSDGTEFGDEDDMLEPAIEYVIEAGQASTSALQRRLKLGYGRAGRIIDRMEELGVIGPHEGSKPRQVLMTKQEWNERKLRQ